MKIAIFSSATGDKWALFIARHEKSLQALGIEVSVVVLDDNREKKQNRFRHAWNIAKRQGAIAKVSTPVSLLRIATYKYYLRHSKPARTWDTSRVAQVKAEVNPVHVNTLNSEKAVRAVQAGNCDLVCLMGTRIISRRTLEALSVPVINIHSSDPRLIRGGPPVFWEILQQRSHITLTVHEVVEKLDAGAILRQKEHPIDYGRGLGQTVAQTMDSAKAPVTDLFFEVILDFYHNRLQRTPANPGKVHVTPSIFETIRADHLCRQACRVTNQAGFRVTK